MIGRRLPIIGKFRARFSNHWNSRPAAALVCTRPMSTRVAICLLLAALTAQSEITPLKIPAGGVSMLAPEACAQAKFYGTKLGAAQWIALTNGPAAQAWRAEIRDPGVREWSAKLELAVEGRIASGDVLLLAFHARGTAANPAETAGGGIVVEQKIAPAYLKLGLGAFQASSEWQPMYVPFQAGVESVSNLTALAFTLAGRRQTVEIADVRLLNYGRDFALTNLPRPYVHYPGREAEAPWRQAALARIESHRVSPFTVEVVDAGGQPVPGARVRVELKRHAFKFGSAIKSHFLVGPDYRSPGYRKSVEENFDSIVFENELKPAHWPLAASNTHRVYREEWVGQALDWCAERDIVARGHYLMIGVTEPWSEALKDRPEELRAQIRAHMKDVTGKLGGRIAEWDMLNHPAGWTIPRKTVDAYFDDGFYAAMFKEARALVKTPLFINEDQVFRPGPQQEYYYEIITNMIARGAAPDGIGNQAHFHASFLPAPEAMLRVSDRFAALVPRLAITEFDVLTNGDEQLQADWLRDCLIMAYSHPAYDQFMLWVFWEGTGYKPECSLWRRDWSPKPNGQVWRDWVWRNWKTDVSGATDDDGRFTARAHHGLHEITVEKDGAKRVVKQPISPGAALHRITL